MIHWQKAFWSIAVLLLFCIPSFGQIYVKANATGTNTGTSWTNAYTNLSTAIQNASAGDKIWVAAGIYTPTTCTPCTMIDRRQTFSIPSGVEVLGGFPATGNPALGTRNWQTHLTILSGDIDNDGNTSNNAYSVIQTKNVNKQTILDGFTIRDGNASNVAFGVQQGSGGAWYNESTLGQSSHPIVRNCIFRNNFANNGAAIFNFAAYNFSTQTGSDCNMDLINCSFLNNLATNQGGAIYNKANYYARHEGVYIDCVFHDNLASFDGGAIYNNSTQNGKNTATYKGCTFTNNISTSGLGGAVYYFANMEGDVDFSMDACTFDNNTCGMYGGAISSIMSIGKELNAVITNTVFSHNSSRAGGAIYSLGSFGGDTEYEIVNCIFFKNEGRTGGAIYFNEQSNATLTASIEGFIANSIFKNNTAVDFDPLFHYSGTPEIDIQNSLIFDVTKCQDLLLGAGDAICSGGMIYNQNPLFINENGGDFHLNSNSPAINTGRNNAVPTDITQDLDEHPRIANGMVDMGVYERTSATADSDNDGINDIADNCPLIPNVNQLDADGDGFGAACDCNDDPLNNGADCASNCATYYLDADGDGFGATATSIIACSPPNGYVNTNTDCDDTDAAIFPGGPELCDNKDNNCNNTIDEGTDEDGDGVCNEDDICPIGDDNIDLNNNNIPDACESMLNLTCPADIIVTTAPGQNAVTVNWQEVTATTNCTDGNTGGGTCAADPITGYTLIGTFNGHHYYLSDNQAIWTQAQAEAVANGGHLAVINDAAENDFIKNAIGANIIHIGLEFDPANNTSAWINGDNLGYDNMETNANSSTVNRYGIMYFWNGKWDFHGDYTKAYVLEIPCSGIGGNGVEIQQIAGLANGANFPIGLTSISYLAMDACGGETTCTFNVIVQTGTSSLSLTCPSDLNVTTSSGAATAIANWNLPVVTSDCNGTPALTLQSAFANGADFPIGNSTVTYEATDNCGNTEVCTFQVNVISGGSNLNLTCPADISITTDAGTTTASANWQTPIATSDCTLGGATASLNTPLASGDLFPIGTTTVTYAAMDTCGSNSTCSFQVTLTSGTSTLNITCPADISITTVGSATSTPVAWQTPVATSDCTLGAATVSLVSPLASCIPAAITGFEAIGEFEGSLYYMSTNALPWPQAKTACENAGGNLVAIESAAENNYLFSNINDMVHIGLTDAATEGNFVWSDGTALTYDNSQSFTPNSPTHNYGVIYNWQPGKWGYVDGSVWKKYILEIPCSGGNGSAVTLTQTGGLANNSVFPIGVTTVVYQASDVCENTASCSFTVTVDAQTLACLDDTNGGVIGTNETSCTAFNANIIDNISLPTGGQGALEYMWLASTNTCPSSLGEQIPGEQGPTLNPSFINQTTYFVRLSRRVGCIDWVSSNCVTKTVDDCGGPDPANYCASNGQQPWQEWIGSVILANLTHPSGKASSGYDDNTNLVVNLTGGQNYEVGLMPGFSYTQFNENMYVWIDFNQDNDFLDAGELVLEKIFTGGTPLSSPPFVTNNFLVPITAINGATRMRVAMKRTASTDPCEAFLQGEVEDYGVFIGGATERAKAAVYLNFDAYPMQGTAYIDWISNTASTEAYFQVERSANNIDFYPLGDEQLPKANNNDNNFYRLEDERPQLGDNFYRVKQVLTNGTVTYTATKNIQFGALATYFTAFPNPAQEELFLRIEQEVAADQVGIIQVVNLLGQVMEYKELRASELQTTIPIDLSDYKNGLYSIHLKLKKQPIRSKTFVVEKNY